jgi:hypothetical protein
MFVRISHFVLFHQSFSALPFTHDENTGKRFQEQKEEVCWYELPVIKGSIWYAMYSNRTRGSGLSSSKDELTYFFYNSLLCVLQWEGWYWRQIWYVEMNRVLFFRKYWRDICLTFECMKLQQFQICYGMQAYQKKKKWNRKSRDAFCGTGCSIPTTLM